MALGSLQRAFAQLAGGGRDAGAEDAAQTKGQIPCRHKDGQRSIRRSELIGGGIGAICDPTCWKDCVFTILDRFFTGFGGGRYGVQS